MTQPKYFTLTKTISVFYSILVCCFDFSGCNTMLINMFQAAADSFFNDKALINLQKQQPDKDSNFIWWT